MADGETINVIVAEDFTDELIDELREVSPRLNVERYYPDVPEKAYESAEILLTGHSFPKPEQAPRLRWIQLMFAGVNHAINEPIIQSEDVEVTTASGIHATQISEFCISMMLAFNYKLLLMRDLQAKKEWGHRDTDFSPLPLRGQTLGIVGYGGIGRELARIADAMGMTVLAIKNDLMHPADDDGYHEPGTGDPEGDIPARLYPPQAVGSMVHECDYVVLAIPLTDDTHHMIDAVVLKQMKKTAVLVNIARGAIVDEAALIAALNEGRIAGAALDVFEQEPLPADSPLWSMPNVIVSPHVAGATVLYNAKAAALFKENLQRYLDNQPLLNRVERERGY